MFALGLPLLGADRSFDGTGNAPDDLGAAHMPFVRLAPANYADGRSSLAGPGRPNPRAISNALSAQTKLMPNARRATDYVWQWGQFLDHDVTLSEPTSGQDASIPVLDRNDPLFPVIPLERTEAEEDKFGVRQQINAITSFIDASQVYGNSEATARELRSFSGGRLRQAPNGLLPFNTASLPMEGVGQHAQTLAELRMAGDIRANEAPGLTAMHTLFVAEHNRLAGELAANHPAWGDERIFQRARKLVGAQMQVITYLEWLPALIGAAAPDLSQFQYRPETDPRISNEFATALFRIGHTMVSPLVMRMKPDYTLAENPSLSLAEAFFNPANLTTVEDYEYYLQGMAMQWHQEVDQRVIDPLRNALFGAPGNGGLDLAALNVQRGREHGLADYNSVRVAYGLPRVMDWSDISSDRALQAAFAETYGDINNVDLWPAALAEDRAPGSAVGELVTAAMAQEFTRLAEGDAFFFLWDDALSEADRAELEATSLADIIERNNSLQVQDNVFVVPQPALEMKKILARGDAGIELRFMSEPGYAYQIYYGESPDDTPTPLLPDALEPTTTVFLMECLDPHAFSAKERFYRIARQAVSEE